MESGFSDQDIFGELQQVFFLDHMGRAIPHIENMVEIIIHFMRDEVMSVIDAVLVKFVPIDEKYIPRVRTDIGDIAVIRYLVRTKKGLYAFWEGSPKRRSLELH